MDLACYLVRHPPVLGEDGYCYGQSDLPLKGPPEPWAKRIRELISGLGSARIISSDLRRCHHFAICLGTVEIDARLRELDFGTWENRRWASLPRSETEIWTDDVVNRRPPGGESFKDIMARAEDFFNTRGASNETTVLVTHAGFIRASLALRLALPPERVFRFQLDFGHVTKLCHAENGWWAAFLNR